MSFRNAQYHLVFFWLAHSCCSNSISLFSAPLVKSCRHLQFDAVSSNYLLLFAQSNLLLFQSLLILARYSNRLLNRLSSRNPKQNTSCDVFAICSPIMLSFRYCQCSWDFRCCLCFFVFFLVLMFFMSYVCGSTNPCHILMDFLRTIYQKKPLVSVLIWPLSLATFAVTSTCLCLDVAQYHLLISVFLLYLYACAVRLYEYPKRPAA